MSSTRAIKNFWLAAQLLPVCKVLELPENMRTGILFGSPDFVMSARVASTLNIQAAEDKQICLAWDEAITSLEGVILVSVVSNFLRGLFLGNIDPRRLAAQALIERIRKRELRFGDVQISREMFEVLACSFAWLASTPGLFEEDVQTLREFANSMLTSTEN